MQNMTKPGTGMPEPRQCEHCGATLPPITAELCGHTVFAGWAPCGCAGYREEMRKWEREREDAERRTEQVAIEGRIDDSGIPPRYRDATHPWARRLADKVKEGRSYYVQGPNGTGKTHLACATGILCLKAGMSVRFAVATELLEELKEYGEHQRNLLSSLARCDLLIIDDLGKEGAATPRGAEKLYDLFNKRYNAQTTLDRKPIIVTSNFPRGEVARRVSEGGSGLAVASRISEMTEREPIRMEGEDRRLTHGKD